MLEFIKISLIGTLIINVISPISYLFTEENYSIKQYHQSNYFIIDNTILYPKITDWVNWKLFTQKEIEEYLKDKKVKYSNIKISSFPTIILDLIDKLNISDIDKIELKEFIRSWKIEKWAYVLDKSNLWFKTIKYSKFIKDLKEIYPNTILEIR